MEERELDQGADKKWKEREKRNRCGERQEKTRGPGQLIEICSRWEWKGGEFLGCARDDKPESIKESMWVILAEMHGNEIWTLKRPHPAGRTPSGELRKQT